MTSRTARMRLLRRTLRRLRPAMSPMSASTRPGGSAARASAAAMASAPRAADRGHPIIPRLRPGAGWRGLGPRLFRVVAGEAQEHVVERRPAQPEIGDRDVLRVQRPHRVDQRGRAARHRHAHRAELVVDGDLVAVDREGPGQRRRRPRAVRERSASWRSTTSPPTWRLSSSAVPSAMMRPTSITLMRSASWSASSRYCVVSTIVVPSAREAVDDVPQLQPAARVEAGRRLVEEQHRRRDHEAGGQVEAPAHAARVRAQRAVGRVRELEHVEQLGGAVAAPRPSSCG